MGKTLPQNVPCTFSGNRKTALGTGPERCRGAAEPSAGGRWGGLRGCAGGAPCRGGREEEGWGGELGCRMRRWAWSQLNPGKTTLQIHLMHKTVAFFFFFFHSRAKLSLGECLAGFWHSKTQGKGEISLYLPWKWHELPPAAPAGGAVILPPGKRFPLSAEQFSIKSPTARMGDCWPGTFSSREAGTSCHRAVGTPRAPPCTFTATCAESEVPGCLSLASSEIPLPHCCRWVRGHSCPWLPLALLISLWRPLQYFPSCS